MPPDKLCALPGVSGERPVVHVTERSVTADVTVPDAAANAVLRRTVAAHRRERRSSRQWMIYGSQVARLVAALVEAGYQVERIAPTTPSARAASTP